MAEISDAARLREYLLIQHSNDYGLRDEELTAYADRARAAVEARRDGSGWLWEAAGLIRRAWMGPAGVTTQEDA